MFVVCARAEATCVMVSYLRVALPGRKRNCVIIPLLLLTAAPPYLPGPAQGSCLSLVGPIPVVRGSGSGFMQCPIRGDINTAELEGKGAVGDLKAVLFYLLTFDPQLILECEWMFCATEERRSSPSQ